MDFLRNPLLILFKGLAGFFQEDSNLIRLFSSAYFSYFYVIEFKSYFYVALL